MNLEDWHLVFVSICTVLILVAVAPLVMAYRPKEIDLFFAFGLLGANGMIGDYYPGDNEDIGIGELVQWNVYLDNQMGEVQYVAVRMKILNSSMPSPNSTSCIPSTSPVVYEERRTLLVDEAWLFPLNWTINSIEQDDDFIVIEGISVNNRDISVHAVSNNGINYRFIFELWVYDDELGGFRFGWDSRDESHCAWTQVWFNVPLAT